MSRQPLITVVELAETFDDRQLRIVDCRFDLADTAAGHRSYRQAHIPGAVYAHLDQDLSAEEGPGRHPLPAVDQFVRWLGAMGIAQDSRVVVYDASGAAIASRLWWMLRSIGHEDVFVLDGGWQTWLAADLPTDRGWPAITETRYKPISDIWTQTVDRDKVRNGLGESTLIDARSTERYRGDIEPLDPVAGHIPTAINLPYTENLIQNASFRTSDELAERFAGVDSPIVYCGSGVTACHNILAMEIAGIADARLYPGSWSDWSSAGEDVATGAI